jgi:hypothetical protein
MFFLAAAMLVDIAVMAYLDSIPKAPLAVRIRPHLPILFFSLAAAWGVVFAFVFIVGGVLAFGPSDKEDVEKLRKSIFG